MIMLDTDTCIYIINKKSLAVINRFKDLKIGDVGVSSVVASELAYGVTKSGSEKNRRALEIFLAPLVICPFEENAIWIYGDLRTALEKVGKPIGAMDLLIASHAIALNATLVTNNWNEFARVPDLKLENWTEG